MPSLSVSIGPQSVEYLTDKPGASCIYFFKTHNINMNYSFEKPTDLKSGGHCKWRRSVWRVCFGLTFWCLVVCLNEPYLQERRIDCIIHQGNKVGRWWMVKWAVWAVIQCKLFDANGVVRCREFVCFGFTLESLVVCRNYQCVQGRRRGCIIHTHTHTQKVGQWWILTWAVWAVV